MRKNRYVKRFTRSDEVVLSVGEALELVGIRDSLGEILLALTSHT